MSGIGIITNPHSKLNKRNPQRKHLLSYIAGKKGQLKITNNLDELKLAVADFKQQGIDIIAINGGDGTISRTITAMLHIYNHHLPLPKICILGGGTMNMVALNLENHQEPEDNLYTLIQLYSHTPSSLPIRTLSTLKVQDHYGFIFANGTSCLFLEQFYKNKSHALGAIKLVITTALQALYKPTASPSIIQPFIAHATTSNQTVFMHHTLSSFCSTVEKLPLGVKLFPNMLEKHFQYVSISCRAHELPLRMISLSILSPQKPMHDKLHIHLKQLTLLSEANKLYTLDGELYGEPSGKLHISTGPSLEFIVL